MTKVFRRLLAAYKRHGYEVRTGLNPFYLNDPDEGMTSLVRNGKPVQTGWGLAPLEIMFLEDLLAEWKAKANILILGNAFGWSTLAVAMACPDAKVVAMDAELEGDEVHSGGKLTELIAMEEGLPVRVVKALSPRDVPEVIASHLGGQVDFVLIDGLHVNEQLVRDFDAIAPFADSDCAFFLHDVLNWHLLDAVRQIGDRQSVHSIHILTRLASGPAVGFCNVPPAEIAEIVDAFVDKTFDPYALIEACGGSIKAASRELSGRLAKAYRFGAFDLAGVYLAEGRLADCVSKLREVVIAEADDAEIAFRAGALLIDNGYPLESAPFFEIAATRAPAWADPPHQLGRVHSGRQEMDAARAAFNKAIELTPDWAPPHFELALVEVRNVDFEAAEREFEQAIHLAPDWFEVRVAYADFLSQRGMFPLALEQCAVAQGLMPDKRLHVWDQLEDCLSKLTDVESAIVALEGMCDREPMLRAPWKLKGIALRRAGDLEGSRRALLHALELVPDWPSVLYEIGLTCRASGNGGEARGFFMRAYALRPSLGGLDTLLEELSK